MVVSARLNTVAAVMAAGNSVIAKATLEGGLAASLLASWAETPVPTWLPALSSTTMAQLIVLPPKGAVRFSTIGSESVRPPALRAPVLELSATAPSIFASIRHDRAVTGHVAARESRDTVTVAWYVSEI